MQYILGSKNNEKDYLSHNKDRYNHTLKYLQTRFPKNAQIAILDIGTSPFTFILKKKFPKASIYSLDYSSTFKKRCNEHNVSFIQHDLSSKEDNLFLVNFDVITFLEVLEHVRGDHRHVIKKLIKNMKPGAVCIVQTPNISSIKNKILKIISPNVWRKATAAPEAIDEFTHTKEYTKEELEKLIHSVPKTKVIKSSQPLYYDSVESALVYRKHKMLFKPLLFIHFHIVSLIPELRAGNELIFEKI